MHRLLRGEVLITFAILIICTVNGCTPDDDFEDDYCEEVTDPLQPEEYDGPPPATTIVLVPPLTPGVPFDPYAVFMLILDEGVVHVWVNGIPASGSSNIWTVPPNLLLEPGQVLDVAWSNRDGSQDTIEVGLDTIVDNGREPPTITDVAALGGGANVDPAVINTGGIFIRFDRYVDGTIKLTDEADVDLNWIGDVLGNTATLTPIAGQELVNEAIYKIEINVWDIDFWTRTGTGLQTTITFATKPK